MVLPSALQQEQWLMSPHLVWCLSTFNDHTTSTCVLVVEPAACQDKETEQESKFTSSGWNCCYNNEPA